MDSASAASPDRPQLEKTCLPKATVNAVGAVNEEGEDEEEKNGAAGGDGDGACCMSDAASGEQAEECTDGDVDLPLGRVGSPPSLVVVADGGEHSYCELAEQPTDEHAAVPSTAEEATLPAPTVQVPEASEQLAAAERLMFITALAPSGVEAPAAEINQVAENHNTLATIVSDHGATTINGAQPQQQQIVYIHGTSTDEPAAATSTTALPSALVHCSAPPHSNVVRIQIIPAECDQQSIPPTPLEDCNNNSVRGAGASVSVVGGSRCQSSQVTVVSLGASDSAVCAGGDNADQLLAASHDAVLVTVTIEDRTLLSIPPTTPPGADSTESSADAVLPPLDHEEGEMVQKKLLVSKGGPTVDSAVLDSSPYVYYMAAMARDGARTASSSASGGSSGQCSPSDMLDSGTCSDIELTPPPLPKKMSQILKSSSAIKKSMGADGLHQPVSPTQTPPPVTTVTGPVGSTVLRQFSPVDKVTDSVINQQGHHNHHHHIELQRLAQQHEEERNRQNEHGTHQTSVDLTPDSFAARQQQQQQRQPPSQLGCIIATDSDGSESCLSCDSLNFEHLSSLQPLAEIGGSTIAHATALEPATAVRASPTDSSTVNGEPTHQLRPKLPAYLGAKRDGPSVCILPDSLLAAIRGSRPKVYCTDDDDNDSVDGETHRKRFAPVGPGPNDAPGTLDLSSLASAAATTTTTRSILMDKINSLECGNRMHRATDQTDHHHQHDPSSNYLQHMHPTAINDPAGVARAQSSCSAGSFTTESVRSNQFESDRYYKFHINERGRPDGGAEPGSSSPETTPSVVDDDESFAGLKDLSNGTSTIRSNKGTVRGVKNRVRNGIATFLQMQQTGLKNYKDKEAGKVVVYSTSMGIVRETYTKCMNVKQILRTLLVKFEEKDIFMSNEYQQEIKERMQVDTINIPQVFVDGQHIGDAECIERLNESGELRKMLKPYKCLESPYMCKVCGGYRLLPCPSCGGSKKSIHRNHFTAEFVALKCMNCDEVGLVKCHNC
ncbi:glutaredoxin domain-containing cysteine-rich protein CG12206-like [Anopheles marshallii]|uniref:glutaredoxin domain-containing cysteine-rich protein CG12206-like n=1 Tax=Anopheles marshallii TaxID=1521116 RepID=UPI00237A43FF|nr:glutaredoxin domain-containing cysteine-rich protein CG12206-like [Anopheles marshallii]